MIPRWKLAREFDRAGQQLKALGGLVWEPFVQWRYDRNRPARLVVLSGTCELKDRIAVYLIFQPNGLRPSTLETCRLLEQSGYSVLAVSNAPLSDADSQTLAGHSWRVIQRPNYGYDFGGYRDGILHLLEAGITPRRLIVMNDSIWYPLSAADTLLDRIDASELDLAGTIVHRAMSSGGCVGARQGSSKVTSFPFRPARLPILRFATSGANTGCLQTS
jgi:Rhamnan synthesis protein F